jgi:lipid-binding SYLF domain-containing protein
MPGAAWSVARNNIRSKQSLSIAGSFFAAAQIDKGTFVNIRILLRAVALMIASIALATAALPASAQTPSELAANSKRAYDKLISTVPAAKALGKDAVAVLVFPRITRAGFVIGGQYGEGALLKGGKVVGYYSTAGASWGLQAGAQQFGYAMFFMNENALKTLTDTNGFEVGVGPTVVVVDEGMARSMTTITANQDVYAFIFGQRGLMAGVGIQGNKITRLNR